MSLRRGIIGTLSNYFSALKGTFREKYKIEGVINEDTDFMESETDSLYSNGVLDKFSLLWTANSYRTSTLNSIIPSNGRGNLICTRADTIATRKNKEGYIEDACYNLIANSDEILLGSYSTGGGMKRLSNIPAPDGTLTAIEFDDTDAFYNPNVSATTLTVTSREFTVTFYTRKVTPNITPRGFLIRNNTTLTNLNYCSFNYVKEGPIENGWISENVGNGWFKIKIIVTSGFSVGDTLSIYYGRTGQASLGSTDKWLIWRFQVVRGSQEKPHQITSSNRQNVPRIDFSTGKAALLCEPARTNSLINSTDISRWTDVQGSTVALDSSVIAPDRTSTAAKLTTTAGLAYKFIRQAFSISTSTSYVFSVYVKYGNHRYVGIRPCTIGTQIHAVFDFQNEVFVALPSEGISGVGVGFERLPEGWFRLYVVHTPNTIGNRYAQITICDQTGAEYNSIEAGKFVYLWGGQLEIGLYPTSLITTFATAGTRNLDLISTSRDFNLFNSREGVLYAEISTWFQDSTNYRLISLNDNVATTSGNRVVIGYDIVANTIIGFTTRGGTNITFLTYKVPSIYEFNKVALRYKSGDISLWVNGSNVASSTSTNIPLPSTLSVLRNDSGVTGVSTFIGHIRELGTSKEFLKDNDMRILTSRFEDKKTLLAKLSYNTI